MALKSREVQRQYPNLLERFLDFCRFEGVNVERKSLEFYRCPKYTQLAEFRMNEQYNYGLPTNDQLCYPHEYSNDVAYSRVLVDTAEQFFNRMIKELERLCINQIKSVRNDLDNSSRTANPQTFYSSCLRTVGW
jgi:hypothetical protein